VTFKTGNVEGFDLELHRVQNGGGK